MLVCTIRNRNWASKG